MHSVLACTSKNLYAPNSYHSHKSYAHTYITMIQSQVMQTYSTVTDLLYILYQYCFYQPVQDHYWNLSHFSSGGPDSEMNISAAIWLTVSRVLWGLHTIFILLNPRSQAAVLTGSVFTRFTSCLSLPKLAVPRVALNSLNSCFSSLMGIIKRSHNNRNSASPYSTSQNAKLIAVTQCSGLFVL